MKRVFGDPQVLPCDMAKSALEAEGIRCWIKNEYGSMTVGAGLPVTGVPLQYAWPEVWVEDDQDFERAVRILADLRSRKPLEGAPWSCVSCGEIVDAELMACWRCDTARAGGEGARQG